jgi:2-polyprenyl-3-methyl-5-hydroxy-6-metoxy-1,4-benzoquinol methylase
LKEDPLGFLADMEETYWATAECLRSFYFSDKKEAKVLEVGSGLGYLTYAVNVAGFNIRGIDSSKEAVAAASQRFGEFYLCGEIKDIAITHKGYYDFVICNQVLEHIADVKSFLVNSLALLSP